MHKCCASKGTEHLAQLLYFTSLCEIDGSWLNMNCIQDFGGGNLCKSPLRAPGRRQGCVTREEVTCFFFCSLVGQLTIYLAGINLTFCSLVVKALRYKPEGCEFGTQ
jgi:hypothetical protein